MVAAGLHKVEGVAEGGADGWEVSRLIWWQNLETVDPMVLSESIITQSIWSCCPTRIH